MYSGLLQKTADYVKVINRKCRFYNARDDLFSLPDVEMKLILLIHVNNLTHAVADACRTTKTLEYVPSFF